VSKQRNPPIEFLLKNSSQKTPPKKLLPKIPQKFLIRSQKNPKNSKQFLKKFLRF
jgi:hypothetical protein